MLSFRGAKLSNQVLKSKTCGREFVFFLEKPSFYALFIGVKEENCFSCRFCNWRLGLFARWVSLELCACLK